ncbi:MAG TPA: hypothetical protein PKI32_00820 [Opitutales bacterium]|nr:hypothetical protein [Opitutales bacterium]
MESSSLKVSFERIVSQSAIIAADMERSLDSYESRLGSMTRPEEMLELGALLSSVRRGRRMALELLRGIPSPNKVPPYLADSVAEVMTSLFNFVSSCDDREATIQRMAAGLAGKSAQ